MKKVGQPLVPDNKIGQRFFLQVTSVALTSTLISTMIISKLAVTLEFPLE